MCKHQIPLRHAVVLLQLLFALLHHHTVLDQCALVIIMRLVSVDRMPHHIWGPPAPSAPCMVYTGLSRIHELSLQQVALDMYLPRCLQYRVGYEIFTFAEAAVPHGVLLLVGTFADGAAAVFDLQLTKFSAQPGLAQSHMALRQRHLSSVP